MTYEAAEMIAAVREMKGIACEEMEARLRKQFPGVTAAQLVHVFQVAAKEEREEVDRCIKEAAELEQLVRQRRAARETTAANDN